MEKKYTSADIDALLARAAKLKSDTTDPAQKEFYAAIADAVSYLKGRLDELERAQSK